MSLIGAVAATIGVPLVSFTGANITDTVTSPSNASAELTFKSDGSYVKVIGAVETSFGAWVTPQSAASQFEIKATLDSGSVTSGTTGSWLSFPQTWTVTRTTAGTTTAGLTIEIRRTSGGSALDSAAFNIEATKEP